MYVGKISGSFAERDLQLMRHPMHLRDTANDQHRVAVLKRWGAGVEYHFQEFNEPYAPS